MQKILNSINIIIYIILIVCCIFLYQYKNVILNIYNIYDKYKLENLDTNNSNIGFKKLTISKSNFRIGSHILNSDLIVIDEFRLTKNNNSIQKYKD